jgi:hypothetical protein
MALLLFGASIASTSNLLRGLRSLKVVVDMVGEEEQTEIAKSQIQTDVELRLRKAGLIVDADSIPALRVLLMIHKTPVLTGVRNNPVVVNFSVVLNIKLVQRLQLLHQHGGYTKHLRHILRAAGLGQDFTSYSLRYSFATLALLSGELDKTVSEQMGHVRTDFTKDVYVQVLPEMRQAASDKLERLLFAVARTPLAHIEADATM